MKSSLQQKILPALVLVAFMTFSFRLAEVVTGIRSFSGTAHAEEAADDHGEDKMHDESAKKEGSTDVTYEGGDESMPDWQDAGDAEIDLSEVKMEVFEDLAERRRNLEKLERDLQVREALLKAAEQELDRKYKELSKLKEEIEALLEQQSEQETERIDSLVKIYQGMKAKDAARIFDTLDLDVLVTVMTKMSERKIAPIMAAMNPERARTVTIMMAEQSKLPTISP